ncbi:hypothetical protein [Streptomyces sp. BPSDS2]|uniref:hypothetical protein n=1 Tax=Streptomyces sp. BPSDS2 TaxID=2571021 RepID=UPI0010C1ECBD|nr:hypothetical protein [Streptomyces sp. BPSDS2]
MTGDEGMRAGARAARRLAELGVCELGPGLSEAEFGRIEAEYGIVFADDHRGFLAAGLPVGRAGRPEEDAPPRNPWPDWRDGDPALLRERLERPVEGLLFSVEHGWWLPGRWGTRPADPVEAVAAARAALASVPKLIPVYGHRYLPSEEPCGSPVLSMQGADIIHYGRDLADWVEREFVGWEAGAAEGPSPADGSGPPFWSDLVF